MCEGAACGPFVPGGGGVVGWDDANHLSSEGQWSLWPELCEFFEARALVPATAEKRIGTVRSLAS